MAMNKKPKKRRPFAEVQNPHKLFRKMTQHHTDVLQNIAYALVSKRREHLANASQTNTKSNLVWEISDERQKDAVP
jgi:hypothetical protein